MNNALRQAVEFFGSIGMPTRRVTNGMLAREGAYVRPFLDGVWIDRGVLVYHPRTVRVADLFHEAGHLAVTPGFLHPHITPGMNFDEPTAEFLQAVDDYLAEHPDGLTSYPEDPGCRAILQMSESEAIAWSFAAMKAAGAHLPSLWRKDDKSFDGATAEIRSMLEARCHLGIAGLQAAGMTAKNEYPQMRRWLQVQGSPSSA